LIVNFTAGYTNTGATTLNINSTGAKNVYYNGSALAAGKFVANQVYSVCYDGTEWELMSTTALVAADIPNLPASKITSGQINLAQLGTGTAASGDYVDGGTGAWTALPGPTAANASAAIFAGTTGGTANAQTASVPTTPTYAAGLLVTFVVGAALGNTGATTLNLNSLGAKSIYYNGAALTSGRLVAGSAYTVLYDGTQFELQSNTILQVADIPSLPASQITSGQLALARGGTNAALSSTGGAHNFLKQSSSGAAITVGQPAFSDISGTATTAQIGTGTTGVAGTYVDGNTGAWTSIASVVDQVSLTNNMASGSWAPGTAVYCNAASGGKTCQANAYATSLFIGISLASTTHGTSGNVQTGGIVTLTTTQWDGVVTSESGGLTAGSIYYLDPATAGNLTVTGTTTTGQFQMQVGIALSTTQLQLMPLGPFGA
jgi:hypothetical protein